MGSITKLSVVFLFFIFFSFTMKCLTMFNFDGSLKIIFKECRLDQFLVKGFFFPDYKKASDKALKSLVPFCCTYLS